jgi:2-methylcitrate dehydratase PrpD
LGGYEQHDVEIMLEHFKEMGGSPSCSVFVDGWKTNPVDAAFLNALMIRAMDYNDIYWKAGSHSRHDHRVRDRNAPVRVRPAGHS